ncbi:MAG: hypothetical protein AAFY56_21630 [Pseudomonadota bacterium]
MVISFGLLALHGLIKFGGGELADFVPEIFDLGPGQFDRWSVLAVGIGTDNATELLHQLQGLGRESGTSFFDSF